MNGSIAINKINLYSLDRVTILRSIVHTTFFVTLLQYKASTRALQKVTNFYIDFFKLTKVCVS